MKNVILAYAGSFFGRAEIFDILKKLRGELKKLTADIISSATSIMQTIFVIMNPK